jgi:pilus assembly protein Flp/PilA
MRKMFEKLWVDSAGATAVEYGLILAMVFLAMVGAVGQVGNVVSSTWNYVSDTSQAAVDKAAV